MKNKAKALALKSTAEKFQARAVDFQAQAAEFMAKAAELKMQADHFDGKAARSPAASGSDAALISQTT